MKKLLASVLICFGMFSFVQAQLKGTTYKVTKETTQAEFDKTCKENPGITKIKFSWSGNDKISNINAISGLKELNTLEVIELKSLDVSPLKGLGNIENIVLVKMPLTNIETLGSLPKIKKLKIKDCEVESFNFLSQLKNIHSLILEGKTLDKITDFKPLLNMEKLTYLSLSKNSTINDKNVEILKGLRNLTHAVFIGNNELTNINFLQNCVNLNILLLTSSKKMKDISVISKFTKLNVIAIEMTQVNSIVGIESSSETLEEVFIQGSPINDISPLFSCKKLKMFQSEGNSFPQEQLEKLFKMYPEIKTHF